MKKKCDHCSVIQQILKEPTNWNKMYWLIEIITNEVQKHSAILQFNSLLDSGKSAK